MRARGDQRLDDALESALQSGPRDVLDLLDAVRSALGAALQGREGVVHAALQRLAREGRVDRADASSRGLVRYARAADVGAAPDPEPRVAPPWAVRTAGGVRDARARACLAADLEAHRAALAQVGLEAHFGPARHVRALLKRVDRGARTVLLPQGLGDHLVRFVLHEGAWILFSVAMFLLLHFFVVQVFVIPSDSMVPTLLQRDRVVVHKRARGWMPERWRVVTYQRPGPDGPKTTYVKRVVGLPGEELALWRGDAYADGILLVKPDDLNAILRTPLAAWDLEGGAARPEGWVVTETMRGGTSWNYDVVQRPFWTGTYELERRFPVQDVYLELDVEVGAGSDVGLRVGRLDARGNSVHFELRVEGGSFLVLRSATGSTSAQAVRLASGSFLEQGRVTLELALVDGVLRARAGATSWRGAVEVPAGAAWFGLSFLGEATRPWALRVDQDLHYGVQGGIGVPGQGPVTGPEAFSHKVGEAAVFCLGDNTADSRDSRFPEVGDVPLAQLIGPVVFRLWPPGRVGVPR